MRRITVTRVRVRRRSCLRTAVRTSAARRRHGWHPPVRPRRRTRYPESRHRAGVDHLKDLLHWLRRRGIDHASVDVVSADDTRKRSSSEVDISSVSSGPVSRPRWSACSAGGYTPPVTSACCPILTGCLCRRRSRPRRDGRRTSRGHRLRPEARRHLRCSKGAARERAGHRRGPAGTTAALPGGPIKDIDLIIRTSGERRISSFLPSQRRT